ncbi:hypothetical protein AVEN_184072-1 [Araneus ventricosus]|uniref:Uncharacterized protein n=1 Tax=Araneus ventricosus TaxID=182803 RepID=A0A4Y2CY17_ARAVE|nr:hypothetical protein AVEN_184072-1 [Araneus ventricosus]
MCESCFPEEFLRIWNRCPSSSSVDAKERLTNLMNFFRTEVEGEERINLAMAGFGLNEKSSTQTLKKKQWHNGRNKISTAANLLTTSAKDFKQSCVFCTGTHSSADCFSAQKLSLADRLNILKEKNCCSACLNGGHSIGKCRLFLKCVVCGKKHVPLMCEAVESRKHESKKDEEKEAANEVNMSKINLDPKVFLQTLKVKTISDKKKVSVRIILDSGSQRSYILKSLAEEMGYIPVRKETLVHSLFGGVKSEKFEYTCYQIRLRSLDNNFTCNFEALDQLTICNDVTPVNAGLWMKKVQEMNITLTDVGEKSQPVEALIGADLFGKFLTGQCRVLSCGLVAIETSLGCILSGKVPENRVTSSNSMLVTTLFVKELDILDLWKIDSIGIKDPIEKLSKKELEDLTKEHFLQTVRYNDDKRYEVHLPWLDNYAPLPDNLELAIRRLESTTKKLLHENLYDALKEYFWNVYMKV